MMAIAPSLVTVVTFCSRVAHGTLYEFIAAKITEVKIENIM